MNTSSVGEIKDRGDYATKLAACLDNAHDLQVPHGMLQTHQAKKDRGALTPVMKLPCAIQALLLEERRLQKEIEEFPSEGRILDRQFLINRLQAVGIVERTLLVEALSVAGVKLGKATLAFTVDANWNMYLD